MKKIFIILLFSFLFLVPGISRAASSFDHAVAGTFTAAQNLAFNYEVACGNPGLLIFLYENFSNTTATAVTFNGVPMTRLAVRFSLDGAIKQEGWGLLNASGGSHELSISFGTTPSAEVGFVAASWTDVSAFGNVSSAASSNFGAEDTLAMNGVIGAPNHLLVSSGLLWNPFGYTYFTGKPGTNRALVENTALEMRFSVDEAFYSSSGIKSCNYQDQDSLVYRDAGISVELLP